jgi:hypothetical protein
MTSESEVIMHEESSPDIPDYNVDHQPDDPLTEFFGEPLSVYTRDQAVKDGVLVDVTAWASSGPNGMMGGFRVPVAVTKALWDLVDIDHPSDRPWAKLAAQRGNPREAARTTCSSWRTSRLAETEPATG